MYRGQAGLQRAGECKTDWQSRKQCHGASREALNGASQAHSSMHAGRRLRSRQRTPPRSRYSPLRSSFEFRFDFICRARPNALRPGDPGSADADCESLSSEFAIPRANDQVSGLAQIDVVRIACAQIAGATTTPRNEPASDPESRIACQPRIGMFPFFVLSPGSTRVLSLAGVLTLNSTTFAMVRVKLRSSSDEIACNF